MSATCSKQQEHTRTPTHGSASCSVPQALPVCRCCLQPVPVDSCRTHLTLCRSAATPDSSSTSLHRACSNVSPSSRNPARVEYLQASHSTNHLTAQITSSAAVRGKVPSLFCKLIQSMLRQVLFVNTEHQIWGYTKSVVCAAPRLPSKACKMSGAVWVGRI